VNDDTHDDPIEALGELFADGDPEPTPGFVDRVEADLRIAHAERDRNRRPAPAWGRVGALASVAVVVLAVATAGFIWRDRSVSSALELTNARGVVVTLPDGSTVDNPADGFDLPEGTLVVVRTGGSATINDVSLGGGAVVTIRDGALVTAASVTTTVAAVVSRPANGSRQATATAPPETVRPTPTATTGPVPTATAGPVPTATAGPVPTATAGPVVPVEPVVPPGGEKPPPPPLPANFPHPGPTVAHDGAGPGAPIQGSAVDLGLRVRVAGRSHRVDVAWSVGPAADPTWQAVVIRTSGDVVADWPLGPRSVLVGESRGPGRSDAIDEPGPEATVVNYRVVLLDTSGGVVARGVVQTVALG